MTAFREQAAIALYVGYNDVLLRAQKLADECCAKWGHDVVGSYSVDIPSRVTLRNCMCARCGGTGDGKKEIAIVERNTFRQQIIFACGATRGAAEALSDTPPDVVAERLKKLAEMLAAAVGF